MVQPDDDGNLVEGFQVHLGGGLGTEPGFGRKARGLKVTRRGLPDYVERVAGRFLDAARATASVRPLGPPRRARSDLR